MLALVMPPEEAPCALISPAFPAQGRGLRDGYLVCSQGAFEPVHLPSRLRAQTQLPVGMVPLADVRRGTAFLATRLAAIRAEGASLLVVDAMSDADLQAILEAAERALPHALLCGSAGLVTALARKMAARGPGGVPEAPDEARGPALVVVGSGSEGAWRQIEALCRRKGVRRIEVRPGDAAVAVRGEPVACTGDVVLHLPRPEPGTTLEGPAARALADRLAQEAVRVAQVVKPAWLILVGGDTAMAVLRRLGARRLVVVRELLPGMPMAREVHVAGRAIPVVLKAGGHGGAEALITLIERLRASPETRPP